MEFRRPSFLDSDHRISRKADEIFSRNVLIVFHRIAPQKTPGRLTRYLRPHAYLFAGHSRNLHDMDLLAASPGLAIDRRVNHAA